MTNSSGRSTNRFVAKRERDMWKALVFLEIRLNKPEFALKKAKLVLIRHSSVEPDSDGLVAGFKFIIDALVDHGVLENDKYNNIGMPDYRWVRVKPKHGYVYVDVQEVV